MSRPVNFDNRSTSSAGGCAGGARRGAAAGAGAGIRKNTDRRRRRPASPRWSEEAVRGSADSSIQLPSGGPTLTQQGFNAWLEDQAAHETPTLSLRTDTPDQILNVSEWLEHQPRRVASTALDSGSGWQSSHQVSTNASPITMTDYSYSPSDAFAGAPAMHHHTSRPSSLPYTPDMPLLGFENNYTLQRVNPSIPTDLLGIGTFEGSYGFESTTPVTRRRLRYKPLSTWFDLWVI